MGGGVIKRDIKYWKWKDIERARHNEKENNRIGNRIKERDREKETERKKEIGRRKHKERKR